MKALDMEVNDPDADRGVKAEKFMSNANRFCPEYVRKLFDKLCERKFIREPTVFHLQSLVRAKLEM